MKRDIYQDITSQIVAQSGVRVPALLQDDERGTPGRAVGDDPESDRWRAEFLYSRAATIYGGSAEIQRNIIARRLLDLGADR